MSYQQFLDDLLNSGHVKILDANPPHDSEVLAGTKLLQDFERHWRLEVPGMAPRFSAEVASWGSTIFYRAAQFLLFRDTPAEQVVDGLASPCPENPAVEQHYNVDLIFRFLPDLWNYARSAALDDPLTQQIRSWCIQWPLSSVGAKDLAAGNLGESELEVDDVTPHSPELNFNIAGFAHHGGLLQLYVDRIARYSDQSRLGNPEVIQALGKSAGMYVELVESLQLENFNDKK